MSDIDFLANSKSADDQEPKNQADKKEKIIWSEPEKDEPVSTGAAFPVRSFLAKKKAVEKSAPKPIIDKNKIIESRQEILKLIKSNENLEPGGKKKPVKGLLAGLMEKFKKPLSHKEILIDYQQVFNQEKIKRNYAANQLNAAKFNLPARPAENFDKPRVVEGPKTVKPAETPIKQPVRMASTSKPAAEVRPAPEKKPLEMKSVKFVRSAEAPARTTKELKVPGDGFFSRFFKMLKDKIAALNRPNFKPIKTGLIENFQKAKSEVAKPERGEPAPSAYPIRPIRSAEVTAGLVAPSPVKPEQEEKIEIKVRDKTLEPAASAQTRPEAPKVIETNLIRGEIITFFDWHKKIIILANAVLIPIFLIAVTYFGLIYYQKQNKLKIQDQTKKFAELTAEVEKEEAGLKEITDFQARLKTISQIFAKHIYWTNFFKFLEDNTIKDVYYAGFGGDTGGNYELEAMASRYGSISEQIDVLRNNEKITNVRSLGGEFIPGDTTNKAGIKFSFSFSILKSIFTE